MRVGRKSIAQGLVVLAFVALIAAVDMTTAAAAANSRCGALATSYNPQNRPIYQHVVVLMEENLGYDRFLTTPDTPFLSQLARDCGSATNFHAATHPSQPNYMAATSGFATAVGARTGNNNIFRQLQDRGRTWKSYQESMPSNCYSRSTSVYKPGHDPAAWYTNLRSPVNTCAQNDVPLAPALSNAIANDALPAYSWITPNECHIFYWVPACSTASSQATRQGDLWLSTLLPKLVAMPSYKAGKTLIIITFDEGSNGGTAGVDCTSPNYYNSHPDCHIPTVAVSPYITPGTRDGSDQNLYSLLGTTQDILGLPRLGRAVGQPSMRPGLHF
jgi:phospholipase C